MLLKFLIENGADAIGDPTQSHCVAIDARAPLYDGGICTRVDSVSLGVVVNKQGARFYDEGEDFWPKRYAIWGRLITFQPGQIAYSVIDAKAIGRFMPPVFPPHEAQTLGELARQLGLDESTLARTVGEFNAACRVGTFDHAVMDDCRGDHRRERRRRTVPPFQQVRHQPRHVCRIGRPISPHLHADEPILPFGALLHDAVCENAVNLEQSSLSDQGIGAVLFDVAKAGEVVDDLAV